jgi:hypothetical protein
MQIRMPAMFQNIKKSYQAVQGLHPAEKVAAMHIARAESHQIGAAAAVAQKGGFVTK